VQGRDKASDAAKALGASPEIVAAIKTVNLANSAYEYDDCGSADCGDI
jgi:hypothetical protein